MTAAAERLVSKGELARLAKVSPSAISKYFERGILGPDVVEGDGQRAKIRLEPALRQIRQRRDPGQALGNGFKVNTDAPVAAELPLSPANPVREDQAPEARDEVGDELRRTKLLQQQITTRRLQAQELAERGTYVLAADVAADQVKIATRIVQAYDDAATDIAQDLSEALSIPARDAEHAVRQALRRIRTRLADQFEAEADALPPVIPHDVAAEAVQAP